MKTSSADACRLASRPRSGTSRLTGVFCGHLSQRTRRYCSRELICIEGEPIEFVFQVLEGTVKIYKTSMNGKRQVIRFIRRKQWFADLTCDEHRNSAEAIGEAKLRLWRKCELQARMRTDPLLASQMFEIAAQSQISAEERLLLERRSASEKVAAFLLDLVIQPDGEPVESAPIINIPMQRADIADYLGLSMETVCRKITEISQSGAVDALTATQFKVNNVAALRCLASRDIVAAH